MPDLDYGFLAILAVTLLATGAVAGTLAGLLGIGGGIVVVPVLFHVFTLLGVDPAVTQKVAVGTSFAVMIPTALSSVRAHWRRGGVDTDLLRRWGPAVFAGVLTGVLLSRILSGEALVAVFATVALAVAFHMAFSRESWRLGAAMPKEPLRGALGVVIGTVSALMGIGGATLSVPVQTLYGVPIRRAVGTASAIGLIIAIPGGIGFVLSGIGEPGRPPLSFGFVSLLGFACIVPMTIVMAPVGAHLAHTLPTRLLRQAFAVFLVITSVRMYLSLGG